MDNKQSDIIQAVEQCLRRNGCSSCENCPYTHVGDGFECREKLRDDIIALLKAQEPIEARLHLCESCAKKYPECDAMIDGIEFGSGVGNDNIVGCTAYVNRWKAQQPRVHGRWITNDDCGELECPICGGIQIEHGMFCTWCGAKMDGGVQDDD